MTVWIATTNLHKIKEIQSFFKQKQSILWKSLKEIDNYTPPEETGNTFKKNAEIKSSHLLHFLKKQNLQETIWILGEDSGLEVLSLNKEPGIYSARYAGPQTTDKKNNKLLLHNLKNKSNREAQYVCALSCLNSEGEKYFFEGHCKGSIAFEEKGENGFGYDPLFIPEGQTQTFGELPIGFKEKISHRIKSLKQLQKALSLS